MKIPLKPSVKPYEPPRPLTRHTDLFHTSFLSGAHAQSTSVIPANLAASHIGEYATVEGVVAKVFTSKNGNTFLNIGAAYPNQTFTGWIPNSSPVKDSAVLDGIEGKHIKITGQIGMHKDKPEIRINAASQLEIE